MECGTVPLFNRVVSPFVYILNVNIKSDLLCSIRILQKIRIRIRTTDLQSWAQNNTAATTRLCNQIIQIPVTLVSSCRSNAWAVQISRENYSEHDVANVLKRFVRQLNEPLLTTSLRQDFIQAVRIQDTAAKIDR